MILAFDAQYHPDRSQLGWVAFADWAAATPLGEYHRSFGPATSYRPGEFFRRELPLIRAVLSAYELSRIDALVVDGYVTLDATGRPGLGQHLYDALGAAVPVVGVAKSYFRGTHAEEVLRGGSTRPLYVTAAGLPDWRAAEYVRGMAGQYRMPDLLRRADALARLG